MSGYGTTVSCFPKTVILVSKLFRVIFPTLEFHCHLLLLECPSQCKDALPQPDLCSTATGDYHPLQSSVGGKYFTLPRLSYLVSLPFNSGTVLMQTLPLACRHVPSTPQIEEVHGDIVRRKCSATSDFALTELVRSCGSLNSTVP